MRRWLVLALALAGCGGASPSAGLQARFRLAGAQYAPGDLGDDPRDPAPEVHTVASQNNHVYRGLQGKSISGTLGPGSAAVLVGMKGDAGHWILPVDALDQNTPGDYTFSGRGSFSPDIQPGTLTLVFRATSADGRVGPPRLQTLTMDPQTAAGALLVELTWDTEADLDLHVRAPVAGGGTVDVWPRKRTALPPPMPGDPPRSEEDVDAAGKLDADSNSQCVIDGQRRETVTWPMDAPAGDYEVRVDAFSLCGEVAARWTVNVYVNGARQIGPITGQLGESDTRYIDHGPTAGVLALKFSH